MNYISKCVVFAEEVQYYFIKKCDSFSIAEDKEGWETNPVSLQSPRQSPSKSTKSHFESPSNTLKTLKAGTHQADSRPSARVGPSASICRASLFGVFYTSAAVCPIQHRGLRCEWELWLYAQFSKGVSPWELKRKWWKRASKWRRHRQKAVLMFCDL